jgi:hypothetical protein
MITDNDIGSLFTLVGAPAGATPFRLVALRMGGLDAVIIPYWIDTGAEIVVHVDQLVAF